MAVFYKSGVASPPSVTGMWSPGEHLSMPVRVRVPSGRTLRALLDHGELVLPAHRVSSGRPAWHGEVVDATTTDVPGSKTLCRPAAIALGLGATTSTSPASAWTPASSRSTTSGAPSSIHPRLAGTAVTASPTEDTTMATLDDEARELFTGPNPRPHRDTAARRRAAFGAGHGRRRARPPGVLHLAVLAQGSQPRCRRPYCALGHRSGELGPQRHRAGPCRATSRRRRGVGDGRPYLR